MSFLCLLVLICSLIIMVLRFYPNLLTIVFGGWFPIPSMSVLIIPSLFAAAFLFGMAVNSITVRFSGKIWGIKIRNSIFSMILRVIFILCGVFSLSIIIPFIISDTITAVMNFFVGLFTIAFSSEGLKALLNVFVFLIELAVLIVGFSLGLKLSNNFMMILGSYNRNLDKLGELNIIKDINQFIDKASSIRIYGTYIEMNLDSGNLLIFNYAKYGLSEISRIVTAGESKSVAAFKISLLALYFNRKYRKQFTVDVLTEYVEGISGSPGKSVRMTSSTGETFTGTIGGYSGTPSKTPFNGYLLKRRK